MKILALRSSFFIKKVYMLTKTLEDLSLLCTSRMMVVIHSFFFHPMVILGVFPCVFGTHALLSPNILFQFIFLT